MREGVIAVDEDGAEYYDVTTAAGWALFEAELDALTEQVDDDEPETD